LSHTVIVTYHVEALDADTAEDMVTHASDPGIYAVETTVHKGTQYQVESSAA